MTRAGAIRVGIGGWTYAAWRGSFYPKELTQKRELEYASRQLTTIEINGTYYRTQSPESFARWHDATPEGFVFAVKAPRYATTRKRLADAAEPITRFITGGLGRLQAKLGPINWQLLPTRKFDAADIDAFLALLPRELEGRRLRHVLEVRHESFRDPAFTQLLREHGVACVIAGDSRHPQIADLTADFVYARLMGTQESQTHGYADAKLARWAERARDWAQGNAPHGLDYVESAAHCRGARDVFVYFISGHKTLNPAAAQALLGRIR